MAKSPETSASESADQRNQGKNPAEMQAAQTQKDKENPEQLVDEAAALEDKRIADREELQSEQAMMARRQHDVAETQHPATPGGLVPGPTYDERKSAQSLAETPTPGTRELQQRKAGNKPIG